MNELTNNPQARLNSYWKKAWIALRFVLFGVFGFIAMFEAWIMLLDRLTSVHHDSGEMSPFLAVPLFFVGAVMMLFGAGEWGRWGYLFVFFSIPVSLTLLFLMPTAGKDIAVLAPMLAAVVTYLLVRSYYARRKSRKANTA